ncbi:MAG: hypothetical protein HY670_06125 [Chloroflexi bacterium]|nr:hypothetical protein [Chloroflexota bacterium]
MDIYISGIHSGPDPSAGLGVARSLRLAFPNARLIGVDYSTASTGLHDSAFHDVWVQRSWNEIDLDLYREQIREVLGQDALWLPCLDTEIRWLAEVFPGEPRILAPQAAALNMIMKPAILAARHLPVTIPPYILANRSHWDLFAFCRRQGWPIWCKGPSHEARLAWNWVETRRALTELQEKWAERLPALQAHVDGSEESITFCA